MHRAGSIGASGIGGPGSGGKIAGLYDLEETLGSGHFAVVKLARHVFTGEKVAVKVIDKTKLDDISRAHLFQEVRCMKLVQHPNVVRLYEVIDTQTKLYLILELGDGGDLYDYILRHESGLSESVARNYFKQIVRAISYCHRLHVVHRDLKPENVVFFEKLGIVKLTDFGFSNKFCPGQKLETSCGSLAYSAPEILLGDSYDAPAVDVWSLGVILFMLVCGHAPFHEANDNETLTMIMDCKYTIPQHVSSECRKLIARMLVREPDKRATLLQISCDPWLTADNTPSENHLSENFRDENLPLVSRQHLNEEDHALIIQKMVTGQIATKEQILDALDKNEYNHITATYYLLAERKLRTHRQKPNSIRRPEVLGVNIPDVSSKTDSKNTQLQSNRLTLPTQPNINSLLSIPRTPGDAPQRIRKCSIVREEEDDEESNNNRRGSRSEGRLHLTLQERLPSSLIAPPSSSPLDVHSNITSTISKVNIEDENTRKRLGDPGMGVSSGWMSVGKKSNCFGELSRPKSAIEQTLNISVTAPVPKIIKTVPNATNVDKLQLGQNSISNPSTTSSDTTMLPLSVRDNMSNDFSSTYKTIPSITTPLKDAFVNKSPTTISTNTVAEDFNNVKSTKYDKDIRSMSCSSSDDSGDETSTNRKKRAPKHLNTPTHKPFPQRRDSHDDSSDSQEHGATSGGTGSSGNQGAHSSTSSSNKTEKQGDSVGNSNNSGFSRRHRCGRRACETRLRESQSLNRISEVHEADTPTQPQRTKGFFHPKFFHGFGKRPMQLSTNITNVDKTNNQCTEKVSHVQNHANSIKTHIRSSSEEKENCHRIVTVTEKHSFKKVRLFSKYFQVHKKICLPRLSVFPGLWNRTGRLYKAQSCGSIVRDKITSAGASSLLLVNELCKDKPLLLDPHRARIKLLAEMPPCNGHNNDNLLDLNSP